MQRVHVIRVPARVDAETVFAGLYRQSRYAFWLDSASTGDERGRWSFLGDATGPYARIATADLSRGTVTVRQTSGVHTLRRPFLHWLDAELRATVRPFETSVPFPLGWVGYLGYELKAECDGDLAHRSPDPDAALLFADRMIAIDHHGEKAYLLALDDGSGAAEDWLAATRKRLETLDQQSSPPVVPRSGVLRVRHDRACYLDLIARCHEAIQAGNSYELCLTTMLEGTVTLDPWEAYRALRRISPSPYAGLLRFGELAVLSTSPEQFLAVSADGRARSRPIKGTRPRGRTPAEDAQLVADLRKSAKDRAENLMIVDLVRNDLARVAAPGSVRVERLFDVESYASAHQLVSTVAAQLRSECTAVDCVRAAFPGGSMTGAPKLSTMRILDGLEGGPRGVYSGAFGYFALSGAVDLAMVIRTAVLSGRTLRYGVGGAIVADSDPVAEYEETVVKAAPLLRLLGTEFPGRSARA